MNHRSRSPRVQHQAWLSICALCCALAAGSAAAEDLSSRFPINDADPESAVPTWDDAMKNPLQMGYWIMLVTERAEGATKKGNHAGAVKYYRALAKAVPDRATSFTRMCKSYEALGDWKNAVASCKIALGKGGVTVADSVHYVKLVLGKKEALAAAEIADLDAVIAHLETELAKPPKEPQPDPEQAKTAARDNRMLVNILKCDLGLLLEDTQRLQTCSAELAAIAPKDPRTITFKWALAIAAGDFDAAEAQVVAARNAGMPATAVERMQGRLIVEREQRSFLGRISDDARFWGASALVLAIVAGGAFVGRRRLRVRAAA